MNTSTGQRSRLSELRRQAGMTPSVAPAQTPGAAVTPLPQAAQPSISARAMPVLPTGPSLALRTRMAPRRAAPGDALPGEPLAEGVRLIQRQVLAAAPPEAPVCFDPGWAGHPRTLVLDTETTGLSGGSGTLAFLIGGLLWDGQRWQLLQLLLESPGDEGIMLDHFSSWVTPGTRLLTYNGASFDLPLLRTRLRLCRRRDCLTQPVHGDLLYATRRRFSGVWTDCRQPTAEHHLLGLSRDGDLPGSEAPAAWHSWLRRGSSHRLKQVIKHNERDLIRLAALLPQLDACYREVCFEDPAQRRIIDWMLRQGQGAEVLKRFADMPSELAARTLRRIRPGPGVSEAMLELFRASAHCTLPATRRQLCTALVRRLGHARLAPIRL